MKKISLIEKARAGEESDDPNEILRHANSLVDNFPNDPTGYPFRGIGNFFAKNYKDAANDFQKAIDVSPKASNVCEEDVRDLTANLAAAQGAAGLHAEGLKTMKSIEGCNLAKTDLFNLAKLALLNGDLTTAEKVLGSPELSSSNRPDLRSRVSVERGVFELLQKKGDWRQAATREFRSAACRDRDLISVLVRSDPTAKSEPFPSKAEDFGSEMKVLEDPQNAEFMKSVRTDLTTRDPCG